MHRRLGIFAICVAVVQLALYAALAFGPKEWDWLFYFDPGIGWIFIESAIRQTETIPGISSWLTAAVTFVVGATLYSLPRVRLYLVAETILALPTLLFIIWIAVANMSPAHGFSVGELLVPAIVFSVFSVLPLAAVIVARRRALQARVHRVIG